MLIVNSINQIPIRLTTERWKHIIKRHPELSRQKIAVLETVNNPDIVQQGDFDTLMAVKHFNSTPMTSKFLVVIFKEIDKHDGFILTAYYTSNYSGRRKTLWKR